MGAAESTGGIVGLEVGGVVGLEGATVGEMEGEAAMGVLVGLGDGRIVGALDVVPPEGCTVGESEENDRPCTRKVVMTPSQLVYETSFCAQP